MESTHVVLCGLYPKGERANFHRQPLIAWLNTINTIDNKNHHQFISFNPSKSLEKSKSLYNQISINAPKRSGNRVFMILFKIFFKSFGSKLILLIIFVLCLSVAKITIYYQKTQSFLHFITKFLGKDTQITHEDSNT